MVGDGNLGWVKRVRRRPENVATTPSATKKGNMGYFRPIWPILGLPTTVHVTAKSGDCGKRCRRKGPRKAGGVKYTQCWSQLRHSKR
jgi:hypothetical protein